MRSCKSQPGDANAAINDVRQAAKSGWDSAQKLLKNKGISL